MRASRIVPALVLVLGLVGACSDDSGSDSTPPSSTVAPYRLDSTLRLDQVQVLGSHNSYHRRADPKVIDAIRKANELTGLSLDYEHAPLPEQFDLGVRQIELDVWDDPAGGKFAQPSLPLQLGVDIPDDPQMLEPGYKVIHEANIDTNSSCATFRACLRLLRTWSDAHPGHVAINVLVELKDAEVSEAMFERLDGEILAEFKRERLIMPDDVRGDFPTLGEAVRTNGWPTLGATRGKVYFAMDNPGLRKPYLRGHPSLRGRVLFTPSEPGAGDAAFAKLNDPVEDRAKIRAALGAHMIVRTRADADTFQARANDTKMRSAALNGGAQLVSTDYERADAEIGTGYVVSIPGGAPARCDPVTAPRDCRPTDVEDPARLTIG